MYLQVDHISKSYGETTVLSGISFGLERGKCLALLGPSGCGKSTLLSILAGLMPADEGEIRHHGRVIESRTLSLSPQERRFAMVFQDLSLWPHMTVAENVGFGLDYLPRGQWSKEQRIEQALRRVGIFELRHRYPSMLSGGQQQRVAIARAIVVEPAVLLMDEPLAALDSRLREELRDEIAALIRRLNITTIYVTHDHTEAMTIAHQIAVMNEGRFEQLASPQVLFEQPATTFVASFLGSANHCPYGFELDDLTESTGGLLFPPHPAGFKRGHLLVRREHITIFPQAQAAEFPGDGMIRWKGVCVKTSFSGNRNEAHVAIGKTLLFRGFTPEPIALDCPVLVQFDPQNVLFVEH